MNIKYPDLHNIADLIAFDIESYDPELRDKGTGVYRKDGKVLGVAISNGEFKEYYSFGHKECVSQRERNINYITKLLNSNVSKVAANILYDADWLQNGMGIQINGDLHDVQMAEPLICEYAPSFSLSALTEKYTEEHKRTDIIQDWCDQNGIKTSNPRDEIYRMPYQTVREYAVEDARLLHEILNKQLSKLKSIECYDLYLMEMELIPLLLQMRRVGVRLDTQAITEKIKYLNTTITTSQKELDQKYGRFNVKSGAQLSKILDKHGVPYSRHPITDIMKQKGIEEGNPKLDKESLKTINHPIIENVLKIRESRTVLNTFFINSFTESRVGDRIHAQFHPLRTDDYGTVSGRFSSTKPNLQQIPSRDETMGKFCREIFIPEDDHLWGKLDWSQIEYRLIAHYGRGDKSDLIREKYNTDPTTDYHQMIMDWTGFDRFTAKQLNFAMAYYMGVFACSKKFGWTMEEAKEFIKNYHSEVPFVKETRAHVVKIGKMRGYVRTILKRRARISPRMIRDKKEHSLFNRLIQGSAADLMKKAMVNSYKAGVFNTLVPHLTVHDELDVSIPRTKAGKGAILELKHIMETCVSIKVPITADLEIGSNWGSANKKGAEEFISA